MQKKEKYLHTLQQYLNKALVMRAFLMRKNSGRPPPVQ